MWYLKVNTNSSIHKIKIICLILYSQKISILFIDIDFTSLADSKINCFSISIYLTFLSNFLEIIFSHGCKIFLIS